MEDRPDGHPPRHPNHRKPTIMTASALQPHCRMRLTSTAYDDGAVACPEQESYCILSSRRLDDEIDPLIGQFVTNVAFHIDALRRAMDRYDCPALRDTCRLLRGAGRSYGYESITQAAAAALEPLACPHPEPEAVEEAITALTTLLQRIRS